MKIGIEVEFTVLDGMGHPCVLGDLLPYTKRNPYSHDGNLFHKDGPMFEIAMRPASSPQELMEVGRDALSTAYEFLPQGWSLSSRAAANYTQEELDRDPYASVMGCSASKNIWNPGMQGVREYADTWRYGGMHLNIDTTLPNEYVVCLDAAVGYPLRDVGGDALEALRRRYYGRAGEYRRKPFGLEYRTLSASAWEHLDPFALFDGIERAFTLDPQQVYHHERMVEHAINRPDEHHDTVQP